ncbi:MAG: carboxypeptidase-like regulatory domain-containing protein [Candidatus Rokuibacteriota bacterium]
MTTQMTAPARQGETVRVALWAALAMLGLAVLGGPAGATHAADHRFIVIGYVTDGAGRALPDVPVVVTRVKTGLEYPTRTERDGLYVVIVHLHDEDEGDRLSISANGVGGDVRARFDVHQKRIERGIRVDVRAGRLVEDRRGFAETLRAYLAR